MAEHDNKTVMFKVLKQAMYESHSYNTEFSTILSIWAYAESVRHSSTHSVQVHER